MRKTKITFFTLCFALLAAAGQAQTPVTIYSGASLPANQGWNELRLDSTINPVAAPASATVGDGVLKLTSTNGVDTFSQLGWYKNNLGLDLSKGYTVEIKAKLNVAGKGAFNIQGFDNEGKGFRIGISETQLTNQSNPLNPTTVIKDGLTNDSEFHIYRLAVATSGIVTVYRDAAQIGTFALSAFDFDNIIENGGFEDAEFPDFRSNAVLEKSPARPFAGQSALLMNSDGKNNHTDPKEGATTRAFPLKPDTDYEFSMTRRRAILDNEWAWRDFGAYWNTQDGSVTTPAGTANAEPRERWWNNCFENRHWLTGTETFNKGGDAEKNTIRFEFPSWIRDDTKNTSKVAIDNVVFREKPTLTVLPAVTTASFKLEPDFHEGYVNLIQNGGFEDHAINNDGTEYAWALSDGTNSNEPVADNPMWGDNVRIQQNNKSDDFNNGDEPYAHSGTSSLRFTTLDNNSKNIDFRVALEANKTYRFHFWHRNPKWNDWGWLRVRIGEGGDIWQHRMGERSNKWTPVDLVFTTTETDTILHLYTTSDTHGGWFNHYFDDFVLYEIPEGTPLDPQLDGKTNLIANGDFEDVTKNNDGSDYNWALASQDASSDSDFPMAYNELWGTWLRIQDKEKRGSDNWGDRDDTGLKWAHSGTKSIRFSFEDNFDGARTFQELTGDQYPDAYRINMNFKKELEPNKTYTFVFWIQVSCWPDRGWFHIANGDIKIVSQELNNRYMNWTRQSVTFSTTASNHTLRIFTEFGEWFNFYLDDLFLYEEDVYQPELAPVCNGDSYLFFGKSQNTASTDVEIEYVKIDNTGAYAPGEPVEPQPVAQKFYIDFGQNASANGHKTYGADANGNYWNNVIAPDGAPSTLNAGYTLPLVNAGNQPTPVTLETTKRWKSNGGANGGLLAPNPELLGDLAVATATEDYFFLDADIADKGAFKLKNLDPAKAYKFYVFGCRQNDAVRGGVFSITGAGNATGYLQNSGADIGTDITNTNDNTIYESLPVTPDANGEILFEAAFKDGGYVYISAVKVEEATVPEVYYEQTLDKKFYIDFGMNNAGLDGSPTVGSDANGNFWNNIGPAAGVDGPITEEAGLTVDLVTSDSTETAYALTTGSQIQWNGVRNGGLLEPDPDLLGDLAIATATHDYLFIGDSQTAVLNFTGLNAEKQYRFNVFGSRTDAANRVGILTIAGEDTVYGIHQMNSNDRNIFVSDLIAPDADGKITLTLSRSLGMSHINAAKLEEISWVAISYTITYNVNGGAAIPDSAYTVETAITLPTPTRTGYTFLGWYDNEGLTGNAVTAIPTGSVGNKAFWAKWQATAYTITYNVNGGVAIPAGTYTIESAAITLPTLTRTGYTFQGWYDNEGLTGDAVTAIPAGSTGNKTFWAKWKDNTGLDTLDEALRIYPNPVVNGKLTIENISPENRKIEVYSVIGTLAGVYDATASSTTIDLSALPAGTYIVKVSGKTAKILKK